MHTVVSFLAIFNMKAKIVSIQALFRTIKLPILSRNCTKFVYLTEIATMTSLENFNPNKLYLNIFINSLEYLKFPFIISLNALFYVLVT